ncbi:hypothetical protein LB506_012060 [Fusarium annulatum]|nr:hypothetical protein LB506_012060 [Fusarium annulatum]
MDQQRLKTEFLHPNSTLKQDSSTDSPKSGRIMPPRKCKGSSRHIESGTSPFLTLPAEIRLEIYRHLLVSKNHAELHYCTSKRFRLIPKEPWDCPLEIHPNILLTCWIINKEATPILYSENVFRRGYCWPRRYAVGRHRMWPICDTSPLTKVNFAYISRLHLFRDYEHWFCDGKLKIFTDFPQLKELDIHIDQNDCADGINMSEFPYQTLKAIRSDLRSFKMEIRLDFHEKAHTDWLAKCRDLKKENFSIHLDKKRALETWFEHEGLFADRSLFWRFKTQRSEWCGPSCYISFAFDDKRREYEFIDLEVWDDSDGKFGRLKTSEENAKPQDDCLEGFVPPLFGSVGDGHFAVRGTLMCNTMYPRNDGLVGRNECEYQIDCILIPFTVFTLLAIHHGLGLATPLFTKNDLSQALKEIFILHLLYVCGLAAAKTSILFFYLRVFQDPTFRTLVWITHAFNVLSTVTLVTLALTLGRSASYLLGNTADSVSSLTRYSKALKVVLAHCVVNLAVDIWMLILPMTQLYNIGLKLNKKINVIAMFGLGLFLTVVSLVRTIFSAQFLSDPAEAQTGQQQVVLWACIETYMGAIVACAPSTRQLIRKVFGADTG